jgi:hypothetical protein
MSSKREGKRRADAPATQMPVDEDGEELEYEDEYGDEFEEEIFKRALRIGAFGLSTWNRTARCPKMGRGNHVRSVASS